MWLERARNRAPGLVASVAGAFAFVALAGAMVSGNGRYTPLAIVLALGGFGSLTVLAREMCRSAPACGDPSPEAGADGTRASAGAHLAAAFWPSPFSCAWSLGSRRRPGRSSMAPPIAWCRRS